MMTCLSLGDLPEPNILLLGCKIMLALLVPLLLLSLSASHVLTTSTMFLRYLILVYMLKHLCTNLSVLETEDLEKHLGFLLFNSQVTKWTYQYISDKIRTKLSSWDSKKLLLADRITLVQSVISTIPTYMMQTSLLPLAISNEVDKLCRKFIWGSQGDSRKLSLVSWKQVQKSKEHGGLGF